MFAPGETQTFIYSLATRTNLFAPTSERAGALANVCDGVQVSFGDPRTMGGSGGGSIAVAARATRPASQAPSSAACDVNRIDPFIGLPFGAFDVPISVVLASDPLPTQPPAPTPVNYNAAPEPAALGLLALGLATLTARRRKRA